MLMKALLSLSLFVAATAHGAQPVSEIDVQVRRQVVRNWKATNPRPAKLLQRNR